MFTKLYFADEFGGYDGSFELPSDATLGVYQIFTPKLGGGSFRVEEYKKPEFEVKVDAPAAPVMLGEKVTATIKASYYFGGPVTEAKVKYKVTRTPADERWYPAARWDWLFGPGYWWFAADSAWYPGWSRWGTPRPAASWWPQSHTPPEVVAEAMVPIRADGTLAVEIDTALARAAHPDQDQRYEITAEITDQSRRTIVGTGTVLVARRPFTVYTWADRGHYSVGDTIEASISAQTLAHKPVTGRGTLKLLKITYDAERRPVETPVETWHLAPGADGQARQAIKAATAGQYRLAATIDDGKGHVIEGGHFEALTVSNGKVHDEVHEIAIPPESRVIDVAVEPLQQTYKPGRKARVKLRIAGPDGKPFLGSTVLTVYDKAVEYVSGGSNVPDIKEWFWKWKRSHRPQTESSLDMWFHNLMKPNEVEMQDLGILGGRDLEFDLARDGGLKVRTLKHKAVPMMGGMGGDMSKTAAPIALAGDVRWRMEMFPAATPADSMLPDPYGDRPLIQPAIRKNFADTALWTAALTTGADGTAEVEFVLPESLTTWKVKAWTMGAGTRVGEAETEIVTTKDLLVRLQAPRFFVEKDEVVLSANVRNKLKTKKSVQVVLELDGSVLEPFGETIQKVAIAAGSEHRVDWRVKVAHEGKAIIRMKALTDQESDAAQMSFPAYIHGMLKMEAFAGAIRPDQDNAQVVVRVPAERKPEQSRLEVRYSPTLAGALVDALPYLADYPYGCTEQTLNRFLPAVIAQNVLIKLGVDLKTIHDKHTNLNAQQVGDARERGKDWQGSEHNPVFDQAEVARMAAAGMSRLAEMQLSDGGWGWFSGHGEYASAHTTALVVHGLQIARGNGLKLPAAMFDRGVAWLTSYQSEQARLIENGESEVKPFKQSADDVDALVFMVLTDAEVRHDKMLDFLDRDRTHLSVYAKALFGLALERLGEKEKLAVVLQNIGQYVVRDDENQTAYLKLPNEVAVHQCCCCVFAVNDVA